MYPSSNFNNDGHVADSVSSSTPNWIASKQIPDTVFCFVLISDSLELCRVLGYVLVAVGIGEMS